MIAVLLLMLQQPGPAEPKVSYVESTSVIDWNGGETWEQALKALNKTGNVVIDGRAARGQPVTVPTLQIKAGRQTFWIALDDICTQAKLQWIHRNGQLELFNSEGLRTTWIARSGPWRGKILRRSIIAYDDPKLDRLLCQIELSLEPRLQPLLLNYMTMIKELPGKTMAYVGPEGAISFDGEPSKTFEIRLTVPARSLKELDNIRVEGTAWLAPGRLTFTSPIEVNAKQSQQGAAFCIIGFDVNQAGKTWEITTELKYPQYSLEFESHQARMFGSMKLVLSNGKEQITDVGRDIRTDAGHTVTTRWLFRNVPAPSDQWKAVLTAPAVPKKEQLYLDFQKVALP